MHLCNCHRWSILISGALYVGGVCSLVSAGQGTYPMGEAGGRVKLVEGKPTELEVTGVYDDLPAAKAGLRQGDVIVGTGSQPFTDGYLMPLRQLGQAIDVAQGARDAKLVLNIRRDGSMSKLIVPLPATGSFASGYPFDCRKSQRIYDQVCANLVNRMQKGDLPGGPVTNSLAVMALLGHRSGKGLAVVQPYVMRVAKKHAEDSKEMSVWLLSYDGVMLCEYYQMQPDKTVAAAIEVIATRLAASIPDHGRYGHGLNVTNVNEIAYEGKGLNGTTTAALWFFASAVRCGLDADKIRTAFGKAVERVRKETNDNGGVGYSWPDDSQSCMRSGHTALAWHHLVSLPQLIGPISPEANRYRTAVATWPTRHPHDLLEAHAVSSLGLTASTAGLAAFDRDQYKQLMQLWRWYFALSWQPNPYQTGQYDVAYVGGPNNTGGDYYLNGHRELDAEFNSIMHATVGFIFAASHERLSFYGGMPPIPGLSSTLMQRSPLLRRCVAALRKNDYANAMKLAGQLTRVSESGTKKPEGDEEVREVAQKIAEHLDQKVFTPEFERVRAIYDGEDIYKTHEAVTAFAKQVRGVEKFEPQVKQLMADLKARDNFKEVSIGQRYYHLEELFQRDPERGRELLAKFLELNGDTYYGAKAKELLESQPTDDSPPR